MAIKIRFDSAHNPIRPELILANRSGIFIGAIPACNLVFRDSLNDYSEFEFEVNKVDCVDADGNSNIFLWKQIKDFKLIYCKDFDLWYELHIKLSDNNTLKKCVVATSLGEAELSQINLYDIQINTEDDIARDDYSPTILYNPEDQETSLLHRILKKAQHYQIGHVDSSLVSMQRKFLFDKISIRDALLDISTELNCLIKICCSAKNEFGGINRVINIYDLESNCRECGHRGEFLDVCPSCGSANIKLGYGDDTSIYVSSENLSNNIELEVDTGSVKNCFRMEAGDDLMTATIANCNPNGTSYIWYISDDMKEDMSNDLIAAINRYNALYEEYQSTHRFQYNVTILNRYNSVIDKYKSYGGADDNISSTIVGYPALMRAYYNAIDASLFLHSGMMPSPQTIETSAVTEAEKINTGNILIAVTNLSRCTLTTATSAMVAYAKSVISKLYTVKAYGQSYSSNTWRGEITVTNLSDAEDTATISVSAIMTDDYEKQANQKIEKVLHQNSDNITDMSALFTLSNNSFKDELKKYCLERLSSFHNVCQSIIDILIQQGISASDSDLYDSLYEPYYNKLGFIEDEIAIRESDISAIDGLFDADGILISDGIKTLIDSDRNTIRATLDFENYIGNELWIEFSAYRREDVYSNTTYISDGLDNTELFEYALDYIETAKRDIIKSATSQHSITSELKNLLAMKEFDPITDEFENGNWIRVSIDDEVYRLRLIEYCIDYENLETLDVKFSDVKLSPDSISDLKSILNQASCISTSYGSVSRQAKKGQQSSKTINDWVNTGLALTQMKIIDDADNQNIVYDNHGILGREYIAYLDDYDKRQIRLLSRGLYVTDDGWKTSKAGIGEFVFYNPKTGEIEEGYGVIADKLIGNLILTKDIGIYSDKNTFELGDKGFVLTTTDVNNDTVFLIQRKIVDAIGGNEQIEKLFYIDDNGKLVINGSVSFNSSSESGNVSFVDFAKGIQDDIKDAKKESADNLASEIEGVKEYNSSQISATESALNIKIGATYTKGEVDGIAADIIGEISTEIKTTKDGIEIDFQTLGEQISDVDDDKNRRFEALQSYIRMAGGTMTFGEIGNDITLTIENDKIGIYSNGKIITYWTNEDFVSPGTFRVPVGGRAIFGNYAMIPRSNGSLDFRWIGD